MQTINSTGIAYALVLLSMVLLGTWTQIFKGLEGRVRTQCLWVDYSIATLIAGAMLGLSLGQTGEATPDVTSNSASPVRILCAVTAGVILTISNLLLVDGQQCIGVTAAIIISVRNNLLCRFRSCVA
jgi:hypothetical protein